MPTLVPKPASPAVTQQQLPSSKSAALRAFGLAWVTLDHEICSLKIRVSVVRLRPWPPCAMGPSHIQQLPQQPAVEKMHEQKHAAEDSGNAVNGRQYHCKRRLTQFD